MQRLPLLLVLLCAFVQEGQGHDRCPKLTKRMVNVLGRYAKHQCDLWDCGDVENQECVAAGITCASGAGRCGEDQVCCQSKTIASTVPTVLDCPEPFYLSGKTCFFGRAATPEEDSFILSTATAACEAMGAQLPRIDSPEENAALLPALVANSEAGYIGLNDMAKEGTFVWAGSETTPATYYNWFNADGGGPPDTSNSDTMDCTLYIASSGLWSLASCDSAVEDLLCERR